MTTTTPSIQDRIVALDWAAMTRDLDSFGYTIVKSVLTREECRSLAAMYGRDDIFRSTIVMARHGFGRGEYKYWSYPLPEIVAGLRAALYPPLAAVASRWNQSMKIDEKALGKDTVIGSLSLGTERRFSFRHKRKSGGYPISIKLENGSLLVMKGKTQTFWQHSVPKTAKITTHRINLTFRTIVLEEVSRI